jgi:hypothetical protein
MATQKLEAPSPPEGAALLPLHDRRREIIAWAVIDVEDYERLVAFDWHLKGNGYVVRNVPHPAGGRNRHGRIRQTQLSLHRAVMGLRFGDPPKVDHRDHDPLNNRKSNLRIGTHAENLQNRRGANRGSSSKYRGVSWDREKRKWIAYGTLDGKFNYLGQYDEEEEAGKVAADWRREHMPFTND